ncbi:Rrf2 family transcriptional regulator [Pseudoroseomonas rhizosphaerae]|uniref:Rrf2 family transcriptional regulator n=1 Tax=Teichococcus rhizosphaerae TaxID=1335062 RepID=A0A2C6Z731_9PROT|nr:Rrf2 family transcriptional regulator [Pseudoroseomonas rhizosphaerae]PHK94311.1 Rrf2 family transcriptional regulator [Pseudoroseomonas rhizosphaerae]
MRLTLYTDYALRTLIYLGLRPGRRVSIREIAAAYRISENHLVKVVHHLGQGGFIETSRGKGGGLRLARAPEEIGVGEVVRFTEEDMALVACFQPGNRGGGDAAGEGSGGGMEGGIGSGIGGRACLLANACQAQLVLGEALAAFMAVLDGRTLRDLLGGPRRAVMAARLGIEAAAGERAEAVAD